MNPNLLCVTGRLDPHPNPLPARERGSELCSVTVGSFRFKSPHQTCHLSPVTCYREGQAHV